MKLLIYDKMGDFYCKKCGAIIQPTKKYKDKDGIIQSEVNKCHKCGSNQISYDTN